MGSDWSFFAVVERDRKGSGGGIVLVKSFEASVTSGETHGDCD